MKIWVIYEDMGVEGMDNPFAVYATKEAAEKAGEAKWGKRELPRIEKAGTYFAWHAKEIEFHQ